MRPHAATDTEIESCLSEVDSFIANSRFLSGRKARMQSNILGNGTGELLMEKFGFTLTEFDLTMIRNDSLEAVSVTMDDAQLSALTCWLLKLMAIRADNVISSSIKLPSRSWNRWRRNTRCGYAATAASLSRTCRSRNCVG